MSDLLDAVLDLAARLRAAGVDVSTGEVLDAVSVITELEEIDLLDRPTVHAGLRAATTKHADDGTFDRCFTAAFSGIQLTADTVDPPLLDSSPHQRNAAALSDNGLAGDVFSALMTGDHEALAGLAALAVDMHAGVDDADGSEKYFLHRVLRAIDISRMLSSAMQQLRRESDLDELELMLRRSEIASMIDDFRRRLAGEIAGRLGERRPLDRTQRSGATNVDDLDLVELSRRDSDEVRRLLQPLIRQLAARIGNRRRLQSTGRLDPRHTVRRSLESGGVPLDVMMRKRRPHRPDIVLLCDVSGSVADFARFTFTMVNAVHREIRRVRTFAFVDGVAEVSDVFDGTRYDVPVHRLVERAGVIGADGHSDYGRAFGLFAARHLESVERTTTVIVTGDARGNHRDANERAFETIVSHARRVFWLNPEPSSTWGADDSLVDRYRPHCRAMFEVRTVGQLATAIKNLV